MPETEVTGPDISGVPSALDFAKQLGEGEESYINQIVQFLRSREKPLDIYQGLEEASGLPQLRTTSRRLSQEIQSIEDAIGQVEPSIKGRTRESMVTEAQRQRMVQAEREPLRENLGKLGTALGRIERSIQKRGQDISTKVGLAMRGQEMAIEPLKFAYSALTDRNARLFSGFTEDRQTQLDQIYAKWRRGNELSDREWQAAQEIASEQREYKKTLQASAVELGVEISGDESIDDLLGIIGSASQEQIEYERSQDSGDGGEDMSWLTDIFGSQSGSGQYTNISEQTAQAAAEGTASVNPAQSLYEKYFGSF